MLRRVVMAVVVLAGMTLAEQVMANGESIRANGQNTLASIDADDDGMIEEPEDCNLSATVDPNGSNLIVMGTQMAGPNLLLVCTGTCSGFGNISGVSAATNGAPTNGGVVEATLNSCTYSGPPWVPMTAEFCETNSSDCSASPSASPATSSGTAGGIFPPVSVNFGVVFQTSAGFFRSGFGRVCNAGSPVVQITGENGVPVIRELEPYPNAQNPTHMCVDNVPVQLAAGGFKVFKTACFPIENGMVNFSLGDGSPFAIVELTGLPPCSSGTAPTMSQWGMILLLTALLLFGIRTLGRRSAFSQTLSLL